MNNFSVGGPQTIFDWIALRAEFQSKLELLDLDSLSILYGLSKTIGYRDDDFVQIVEEYMSKSSDPIRMRFDLAYLLGSHFWDSYEVWGMGVQPGEPGYMGDMVDDFHDLLLAWVLEGLSHYSSESDVMDSAFFLVSRTGNYDTFLEEADVPLMETAANKEISIETSEGGRELVEIFRKFYRDHFGNDNGTDKKHPEDRDVNAEP
jgi:hypothetical protein